MPIRIGPRTTAAYARAAEEPPVRGAWYHRYLIALFVIFMATVVLIVPNIRTVLSSAQAGFWILAVLALLVDTPLIRGRWTRPSPEVLTSVTFCFTISYGWGYGTARITQSLAILLTWALYRRQFWPTLFDLGRYGLALAASSGVANLAGRPEADASASVNLPTAILAAAVWYLTFRLVTGTGTWLREGGTWTSALTRNLPGEIISAAALLALSPMLLLISHAEPWLIPLVLAPIYAVGRMTRLNHEQREGATHDPLTGLPNRLALARAVSETIRRDHPPGTDAIAALLVVDVAQLGHVNTALGHRTGDEVLIAAGHRLADHADARTLVARLQGDEFAVFMWSLPSAEDALTHAGAIQALFDEPVHVGGQPLIMSVSVGISLCPAHGTTFDTLERHADTAMERAKNLPTRTALFAPDHDEPTAEQLTLLAELRQALDEPHPTQIIAYYQPQVDIPTGHVVGFEALLRWHNPARGMISPGQILHIAEHSPLMHKISITMLDQVITQLATWRSQGWTVHTSVNVSVRDLYGGELVTWLAESLRSHGVAPSQLTLELTESALMSQPATVLAALQSLRSIGVGAALDDFGTGYSSLQHLRSLPLTEIKIDQSFVRSMMSGPRDEAIVRAVIELGQELDLRVVAEGVEDEPTAARLLSDGCHIAQGWYFAKPMPAAEASLWRTRYADTSAENNLPVAVDPARTRSTHR